jgi:hypothetical protein
MLGINSKIAQLATKSANIENLAGVVSRHILSEGRAKPVYITDIFVRDSGYPLLGLALEGHRKLVSAMKSLDAVDASGIALAPLLRGRTGLAIKEDDSLAQFDTAMWSNLEEMLKYLGKEGEYIDAFATHFSDPVLWGKHYESRLKSQKNFVRSARGKRSITRFFVRTEEGKRAEFKDRHYNEAVQLQTSDELIFSWQIEPPRNKIDHLDLIWIPSIKIAIIWQCDYKEINIDPAVPPTICSVVLLNKEADGLEQRISNLFKNCFACVPAADPLYNQNSARLDKIKVRYGLV